MKKLFVLVLLFAWGCHREPTFNARDSIKGENSLTAIRASLTDPEREEFQEAWDFLISQRVNLAAAFSATVKGKLDEHFSEVWGDLDGMNSKEIIAVYEREKARVAAMPLPKFNKDDIHRSSSMIAARLNEQENVQLVEAFRVILRAYLDSTPEEEDVSSMHQIKLYQIEATKPLHGMTYPEILAYAKNQTAADSSK